MGHEPVNPDFWDAEDESGIVLMTSHLAQAYKLVDRFGVIAFALIDLENVHQLCSISLFIVINDNI